MSLKFRYFLFIGMLHLVLGAAFYWILADINKWYFLASELFLLATFALSFDLYRRLIKPIKLMQSGTNALENKDFTVKFVETGSVEMDRLIKVYNTMIDTLREEQTKTEEQSYFLEKLIQASPIGIIILDFDDKISDINPTAQKILNLPHQIQNSSLAAFDHPLISQILDIDFGHSRLLTFNGFEKYSCQVDRVIHKGFPRKFILISDLTSEILESEKKAYGKVIRMMAHEVNNSMGAINSILDTAIEYGFDHSDADPEIKESLEIAVGRNKSLAKFIDNFADIIRLPQPQKSKIELNRLLQDAVRPWEGIGKNKEIAFFYKLSEDPIFVDVDAAQMERVISNAIKNAIESIESDGHITIESHNNPFSISIIDDGPGLSPAAQKKLFSPFYSTKSSGQGIGLMLCREIIENHGGKLTLETDESTGLTHFNITELIGF